MSAPAYDRMGIDYAAVRQPDPRIEAALWDALGDARSVLNVGAGTGSYEPPDREVVAVEPSAVMIAQRPAGAATAIQGVAEDLPLADKCVDATMGVFTMQHWRDVDRGLAEVLRVTRDRVVFITLDVDAMAEMWLARDYLPEMAAQDRRDFPSIERLAERLPNLQVDPLPVPRDCSDGFFQAYWRRPAAYLDEAVRDSISVFHVLPSDEISAAIERLRADLGDGTWNARNAELLGMTELDVGLRLVVRSF